jgi:hypothetical protein
MTEGVRQFRKINSDARKKIRDKDKRDNEELNKETEQ